MKPLLIFVYNAKTGFWNKSIDAAHKIISPSTYVCDLCSLTHGYFSENKIWKDFRENANAEFVFMYKNEFLNTYSNSVTYDFPVILQKTSQGEYAVLFDSKTLASITSVEELVERLKEKLRIKSSLADR